MANGTDGSSALKLDNSERIEYLNGLKANSVWGLKTILQELETIGGEVNKGSPLEISVKNYLGLIDTTDISDLIKDLDELEKTNIDESKTSVVDEVRIKELVEDYERYTEEKGFSDKEALDQIYNENKNKISLKDLENFLQKQRENFLAKKKDEIKIEKEEEKEVEEKIKEEPKNEEEVVPEGKKVVEISDYKKSKEETKEVVPEEEKAEDVERFEEEIVEEGKNVVEQKVEEIGKKIREEMDGDDNFEKKVEEKIKSIINEDEVKTQKEEIDDLAQVMAEELRQEKNSEIEIKAKEINIELEKWTEKNSEEVNSFRKEEFEENFIDETKQLNPDIKAEELDIVKSYSRLISGTFFAESIIDGQKEVALTNNNKEFSPGELERGWTDLKGLTNFLTRKPEEINSVVSKHESIKDNLSKIKLPNNRFTRSFDNITSVFKDSKFESLFFKTQNKLSGSRFEVLNKLTGGFFEKTITRIGGGISKIGNQAVKEFASNAVGQMASMGFKQGFSNILKGIFSGGVKKAVGAAGKVVAGTAIKGGVTVAAGAATGGLAILANAALEVFKKIKGAFEKIAEKLGISIKKGLEENFGKVGGAVINGAATLVGLPILLVGMAFTAVALPVILIFSGVFGGLFGYQTYLGGSVSSLVPPEERKANTETGGGTGTGTNVSGEVGTVVRGIEFNSNNEVINFNISNPNISKSVIGMDVYYGDSILNTLSMNSVIETEMVGLLRKVATYIQNNQYVSNKVIATAGMYDPSAPHYPHRYGLGIDLFNQWSYSNNGTNYYPYADYADSGRYRKFICEVCNGNEACPQNINYHIYEEIFRPAGWCWGGYWGESNFDPMHYEVLRPWASSCSTGNKIAITCN